VPNANRHPFALESQRVPLGVCVLLNPKERRTYVVKLKVKIGKFEFELSVTHAVVGLLLYFYC
jgi:hypothetical protein